MPEETAEEMALIKSVPLIRPDLPRLEDVELAFREILESGRISNFGRHCQALEAAAGEYLGTQVVAVSSGTQALLFALQAAGVKPGDEVALPSFTFMATAHAVLYAGATPVFVEIRDDMNMDPADLAGVLASHAGVTAVIGVHVYGLPAPADEIAEVVSAAERRVGRRIPVIYDAAHAFGSAIGTRRVGSFGTAEVFSLSVTKALVCVEGGFVSTTDEEILRRVRKMRNYGIEGSYDAWFPGLNGKMSEFHAAVGLANLTRLDNIMATRQQKALAYRRAVAERTSFRNLDLPDGVVHTFKDFVVLMPAGLEDRRSELMAKLKDAGIETRAYFYPPVHEQKFFTRWADRDLPLTSRLSRAVVTLPFFTTISDEEIEYVVENLAAFSGSAV